MKKNKSSILNKTGDIKIKIVSKTLDNLFLRALEGLARSIYRNYKTSKIDQIIIPIKVSSIDINSLLVDFLSEVLYKSEINKAVFPKAKIKKFTNSEIEAELIGEEVHKFDRKIKSVSYKEVSILRGEGGLWQTEITFDI
jgi:SHS2 domain-containing protein